MKSGDISAHTCSSQARVVCSEDYRTLHFICQIDQQHVVSCLPSVSYPPNHFVFFFLWHYCKVLFLFWCDKYDKDIYIVINIYLCSDKYIQSQSRSLCELLLLEQNHGLLHNSYKQSYIGRTVTWLRDLFTIALQVCPVLSEKYPWILFICRLIFPF